MSPSQCSWVFTKRTQLHSQGLVGRLQLLMRVVQLDKLGIHVSKPDMRRVMKFFDPQDTDEVFRPPGLRGSTRVSALFCSHAYARCSSTTTTCTASCTDCLCGPPIRSAKCTAAPTSID
jgi:hypothetical protein